MAKYTVIINTEEDLKETWVDPSCPNFGFGFNQTELSQCIKLDNGTWEATYESMEVDKPRTYTYLDVVNGGETTYTLQPGEYGVKP